MPLFLGSASPKTISIVGERQTHVRSIVGWGDRIATMVLTVAGDGTLVSPVVLIYRGKGKQISQAEQDEYKKLPNIVILWQKKAWIDAEKEKEVMKHVIVHYAKSKQTKYGANTELLLTQDRGPGHDDGYASSYVSLYSFRQRRYRTSQEVQGFRRNDPLRHHLGPTGH